jgi:hypothetical protein
MAARRAEREEDEAAEAASLRRCLHEGDPAWPGAAA